MEPNKNEILKIDCRNCLKREFCTNLCQAARLYVDQDQINLKEIIMKDAPQYGRQGMWEHYEIQPGVRLNERELCIFLLKSRGIPGKTIQKVMKLTSIQLGDIIRKMKNKFKNQKTKNGSKSFKDEGLP
jgi:hypothetical protein